MSKSSHPANSAILRQRPPRLNCRAVTRIAHGRCVTESADSFPANTAASLFTSQVYSNLPCCRNAHRACPPPRQQPAVLPSLLSRLQQPDALLGRPVGTRGVCALLDPLAGQKHQGRKSRPSPCDRLDAATGRRTPWFVLNRRLKHSKRRPAKKRRWSKERSSPNLFPLDASDRREEDVDRPNLALWAVSTGFLTYLG